MSSQSSPHKSSTASPLSPSKRKRLEDIEAGLAEINKVMPAPRVSAQSSTPGPSSQLPQAGPSRWPNTPEPNSQKNFTSSPSILETPGKKKRLQDIEAGLRSAKGQRTPLTRNESQTPVHARSSFSAQTALPRHLHLHHRVYTPEKLLFLLCPPPTRPRKQARRLTGTESSRMRRLHIQDSNVPVVEPSTPKNRRLSPLLNANGNGMEDPSSLLLTPPQTTQRRTRPAQAYPYEPSGSTRPEPSTPTGHEGKERANLQWERVMEEDEENPFLETSARQAVAPSQSQAQECNTLPRLARAPRTSLDSEGSPSATDQIAANVAGIKEPIQALQAYMHSLEQLDAAKYIEKLDRQKHALALADEAKKKRIAALSVELDALREKLQQSEENSRVKDTVIAALKARRPP
ncbi:hypothetical protein BU15DRAFT_66675 [Melanogaster broomeanus]|nr:hypothetical protein BU15DRAFT_66675 [Melanogaster broomeanus]